MLCIFCIDTSNACVSISIFSRQGPFSQAQSRIIEDRQNKANSAAMSGRVGEKFGDNFYHT